MNSFLAGYLENRAEGEERLSELPCLEDLVADYIRAVLVLTRNNIARAARILDISRTTLYKRIRR